MYARSTKLKYVALLILPLTWVEVAAQSAVLPVGGTVLDPQGHPAATGDKRCV